LSSKHPSIAEIEESYAEKLAVAQAIWLPSVRSGILWTIRAVAGPDTRVIGPAFTCESVHEAIAHSGSSWQLVDAATDGFLMGVESMWSAGRGPTCTVFSEVFGHIYDFSDNPRGRTDNDRDSRILDMAVTVPNRTLLDRLADNDVALVSFGTGKCMTAGWGAIGFTRDSGLAAEIKSLRDSSLTRDTGRLRFSRSAKALARTAFYGRPFYGAFRRFRDRPMVPDGASGGAWHLPSTVVDRRLSRHNLMRAGEYEVKRRSDAAKYRDNLRGATGICLPPFADNALSHFTVRVSADSRPDTRRRLWRAGIDTGIYFAFPAFLSRQEYPNAHRLSAEVLNLPLGPGIDEYDIDRISEVLIRCSSGSRDQAQASANPAI
jgi:dTDP-4-amino-4,6-dideoxygalactose transaminase